MQNINHSNTELYKKLSEFITNSLNNAPALNLVNQFSHHFTEDGAYTYTWCIALTSQEISDEEYDQFDSFSANLKQLLKTLTNTPINITQPIKDYNPDCFTPIFIYDRDYSILIQDCDLSYTITLNEYAY